MDGGRLRQTEESRGERGKIGKEGRGAWGGRLERKSLDFYPEV